MAKIRLRKISLFIALTEESLPDPVREKILNLARKWRGCVGTASVWKWQREREDDKEDDGDLNIIEYDEEDDYVDHHQASESHHI